MNKATAHYDNEAFIEYQYEWNAEKYTENSPLEASSEVNNDLFCHHAVSSALYILD